MDGGREFADTRGRRVETGGIPMSMFIAVALEEGEIPEDLSSGPGVAKSFANCFDDLNATARGLGLKPLGDFYVDHMEQLEAIWNDVDLEIEDMEETMSRIGDDGPWFVPDDALETVHGLIRHVESSPAHEGPLTVLKAVAAELEYARRRGVRFHFGFQE
jgi:hypothetical protein